jgi:hypothetical protein
MGYNIRNLSSHLLNGVEIVAPEAANEEKVWMSSIRRKVFWLFGSKCAWKNIVRNRVDN